MSDIYNMRPADAKNAIDIFLTDDVGGSSGAIERAERLLAGLSHGAEKAVGSAIKRAAISGEAYAARAVGKYYVLKVSDFKRYTQSKRRINTSNGQTTVDIEFRGVHVPLLRFDAKMGGDGRFRARVKRSSSAEMLRHVFRATMGTGHIGLFERAGTSRTPIEQLFGPSTPQMMDANDDVSQEIGDKIRKTFEERIDHEILAVLNGWHK